MDLLNPGGSIACPNANCTGQLQWSDGVSFTYDAAYMDSVTTSGSGEACMLMQPLTSSIVEEDCAADHRAACQLDCLAEGKD